MHWPRATLRLRKLSILLVLLLSTPLVLETAFAQSAKSKGRKSLDAELRQLLSDHGMRPLAPQPSPNPALVRLGQALFFDSELSGNRDISCATCHHPFLSTGDGLALPIGTGAVVPGALGLSREIGEGRELIPRNAPEVFNRGAVEWVSQFWDSRIEAVNGGFISPAGLDLPVGMPNVLSVQAMFPVTSRDEMRGNVGDVDIDGFPNELAMVPDDDLPGIWNALMDRLLTIPGYQALFTDAWPDVPAQALGFEHAAMAIAAFEIEAYTFTDCPLDRYVAGETNALSSEQKRGAILFYGKAKCAECHSGPLMTDQQHYNIGVPQLGPGKGLERPLDHGRGRETGNADDLFRFRTPPLRNCEVTAPYMHNGAYNDLESVIRHHISPRMSLLTYDPDEHLDQPEVRETFETANQFSVMLGIDDEKLPGSLTKHEIRDLMKFMKALTAPKIQKRLDASIPNSVPSGLPLDGI